jgi:hypothetical protein
MNSSLKIAMPVHRSFSEGGNGSVYDPKLARFLNPDPVIANPTFAQDCNAYSYVRNNPLGYVDPSGYRLYAPNDQYYTCWDLREGYSTSRLYSGNSGGGNYTKFGTIHSPSNQDYIGKELSYDDATGSYVSRDGSITISADEITTDMLTAGNQTYNIDVTYRAHLIGRGTSVDGINLVADSNGDYDVYTIFAHYTLKKGTYEYGYKYDATNGGGGIPEDLDEYENYLHSLNKFELHEEKLRLANEMNENLKHQISITKELQKINSEKIRRGSVILTRVFLRSSMFFLPINIPDQIFEEFLPIEESNKYKSIIYN